MTDNEKAFLAIVKLGIGTTEKAIFPPVINWNGIKELAEKQVLSAIVIDGIELLPEKYRPPKELLLEWIGEVLQVYEYRYDEYQRTIAEMASFYNSHGFKLMVLKGYACSLNWPKPKHRPCGDIDIWQFGEYKKADALIISEKGIKIDNSHHHHTVFYWRDFMVENHYDFLDTSTRKSSREQETILKELGKDDTHFVTLNGEKVYLPSPNLHALFLIRHMVDHFASVSITLRQLLDWAFFVKKHSDEIDWGWLYKILEKYHLKDFTNCLNAICVENLGFESSIFHGFQFNPSLKEKILADILNPEFEAAEPHYLVPRLIYKYRRWQGNAWKQKLCYPESRWDYFWSGLWAKIIKPSSI